MKPSSIRNIKRISKSNAYRDRKNGNMLDSTVITLQEIEYIQIVNTLYVVY